LTSNDQSGSSNGAATSVASIGGMKAGRFVDAGLVNRRFATGHSARFGDVILADCARRRVAAARDSSEVERGEDRRHVPIRERRHDPKDAGGGRRHARPDDHAVAHDTISGSRTRIIGPLARSGPVTSRS
jgi:hypothetical protein